MKQIKKLLALKRRKCYVKLRNFDSTSLTIYGQWAYPNLWEQKQLVFRAR